MSMPTSITVSTPNYSQAKRRTAEEYAEDTALPREDKHADKDDMSKWIYHTHQPAGWSGSTIKYCVHVDGSCHRISTTIEEWYERFGGND